MHEPDRSSDSLEHESVELARAFLAGERKAFDHLMRLHQRTVFTICYRFFGDYDEADDCAQDVFIKVFRFLDNFRFDARISTWLYRIAVNTCKNRLNSRAYRRQSTARRLDIDGDDALTRAGVGGSAPSPAAELSNREIDEQIQRAVTGLPEKQRLVVVLRDYEGKTYEEIAALTGLNLGTVKSTLSRARLRLRELLKGTI